MKNLLSAILSLAFVASCTDIAPGPLQIQIPLSTAFDINGDSINDFVIDYREYTSNDEPSSTGSIIGYLQPLCNTELLHHTEEGYLFLNNHDQMTSDSNRLLVWNSFGADLIKIDRKYDVWTDIWIVLSQPKDAYVLGYKTLDNGVPLIGYLVLELDELTGEISILDNQITSASIMEVKLEN